MKAFLKLLLVAAYSVACSVVADADPIDDVTITFGTASAITVGPNAVSADPGTTFTPVFEVTSTGPDFLGFTGISFCSGSATPPCSNTSFGTFTETNPGAIYAFGPHQGFPFDFFLDLATFTISPSAVGTVQGNFFLDWGVYSKNPIDPANLSTLISAHQQVIPLSINAKGTDTTVSTPEPAVGILLCLGLGLGLAFVTKDYTRQLFRSTATSWSPAIASSQPSRPGQYRRPQLVR